MSEIPSVFISYPRDGASGQRLARDLYKRLKKEKILAFIDEQEIQFGDRWIKKLSEGIEHCKIMLLVVAPTSHDRPWLEKEYIMAKSFKALIIPVLASDGKLPIAICNFQSVKLFGDKKEEEWVLLLERILKHLKIYKKASVEAEIKYLKNLLQDNDQSSLDFAGKVYVGSPCSGENRLYPH